MENTAEISGYILAGGKSSRMGTNKALLLVNNEPLLIRAKNLLEPFCEKIAISGQDSDYENLSIAMVPDLYAGCGPVSGILSSLKHSNTDWNLFISVDTPFVNEELLHSLISQIGQFDCIIPEHEGGIEPLIGLYNRTILPLLEETINQGDYKLQRILSKLNTCYVDCNLLIEKYPRLFFNVNHPADFNSI
ncbi:MAG: hypothetical protein A2066_06870 [Bacteroidetes bacterium GWB2_41_8]|nr:MAG: hypothetical protein A2066_06870 [Bacteroidetes bacterium GWB2_41_8]